MARLGSVPPASRYDGVTAGPRFTYLFEAQQGLPVDGTNARLRNMSPFTLRFVPPSALLYAIQTGGLIQREADVTQALADADAALATSGRSDAEERLRVSRARATAAGELARTTGLIESAALGADSNGVAKSTARALALVSGIGDLSQENVALLESFVSAGQFFSEQNAGFVSTLADALMAADVALQLTRMLQSEPLTLLINPNEMTTSHTRVQSYQQRGRFGYIYEAWGAERPTISFSGSTAGFVAGAPNADNGFNPQVSRQTAAPSGYQAAARLDSAAWQNFMSLYQFYRNNGYIYDTLGKSEAHLFIGAVAIDYDQFTYVGNIDTFEFSFNAEQPNRVEFSMDFHVSAWYDNAKSSSTVSPTSSGPNNPRSGVNLLGDVGAFGQRDPVDTATVPFDLLPS